MMADEALGRPFGRQRANARCVPRLSHSGKTFQVQKLAGTAPPASASKAKGVGKSVPNMPTICQRSTARMTVTAFGSRKPLSLDEVGIVKY